MDADQLCAAYCTMRRMFNEPICHHQFAVILHEIDPWSTDWDYYIVTADNRIADWLEVEDRQIRRAYKLSERTSHEHPTNLHAHLPVTQCGRQPGDYRHESELQALLEQSFRREFAMHTNVVVMPAELPGDSYPAPDSDTATLHHARKGAR